MKGIKNIMPNVADGVITYGKETMKGLILLNSGSAAALLAFIGHLAVSGMKEEAKMFALPLYLFLAASIMALAGMGLSYLSQNLVMQALEYLTLNRTADYEIKRKWSLFFMTFAVLAIIISFSVCAYAVWLSYFAFMAI